MTFSKLTTKVPQEIGTIVVHIKSWNDFFENGQEVLAGNSIRFSVTIGYSDGSLAQATGNLKPHLTPQQISTIENFIGTLRIKAISELL
jgi:hypothetical protein